MSVALIGFSGSRSLPASASPLVAGVVRSVLRSGRGVAVGCCLGTDRLALSAALGVPGAAPRLSVFAAFGPVPPPWPAPRVSAPGSSRSVSWPSGVDAACRAGASVSWWAGGGPAVPLAGRLASRSAALVSAVAASGVGRGFVGFVSSPCPSSLGPSSSPSDCFSGSGSGSWGSLALAVGLGLPVVVFPLAGSALPSSWGSWVYLSGPSGSAWAGGWGLQQEPALFGR